MSITVSRWVQILLIFILEKKKQSLPLGGSESTVGGRQGKATLHSGVSALRDKVQGLQGREGFPAAESVLTLSLPHGAMGEKDAKHNGKSCRRGSLRLLLYSFAWSQTI